MDFSLLAKQLTDRGLFIWPNFLCPKSLHDIQVDFNDIQEAGGFSRAAIGQTELIHDMRRDSTFWLDRGQSNVVQNHIWDKIDSLRKGLNRSLFLGITGFEGHYASYSKGGFYCKHLDGNSKNKRIVSLALYLNHQWKSGDGGQLRIHYKSTHIDINPTGGTLVCFLSRELVHEVLLSHTNRSSFTGWFKTA